MGSERDATHGLRQYATVIALAAQTRRLSAMMRAQAGGTDPTPEMRELLKQALAQHEQQLCEMLADAGVPGAPDIAEVLASAGRGDAALAQLVADRTPDALDAVALHVTRTGEPALLAALLSRGAAANASDDQGRTLLIWACAEPAGDDAEEVVRMLVAAGSDVHSTDDMGHTPLHHAASRAPSGVVRLLIDAGADVRRAAPGGVTPLKLARYNPDREQVMLLLRAAGAFG